MINRISFRLPSHLPPRDLVQDTNETNSTNHSEGENQGFQEETGLRTEDIVGGHLVVVRWFDVVQVQLLARLDDGTVARHKVPKIFEVVGPFDQHSVTEIFCISFHQKNHFIL